MLLERFEPLVDHFLHAYMPKQSSHMLARHCIVERGSATLGDSYKLHMMFHELRTLILQSYWYSSTGNGPLFQRRFLRNGFDAWET